MKYKWYRTWPAKVILVIAAHILAILIAICCLWVSRYPILTQELFALDSAKVYENSDSFSKEVELANENVLEEVRYLSLYGKNGTYDADKVVDVPGYVDNGTISGKDTSGLSYRLNDLYEWGKLISTTDDYDSELQKLKNKDGIIACKRSQGTYHYYKYQEFKDMIDRGELSFVVTGDSSADEILAELKQGKYDEEGGSNELKFRGLQDKEGKIVYINCWNYDGVRLLGEYKTASGQTVLELVNNSEQWNGKLNEVYEKIESAVGNIYYDIDSHMVNQDTYKEGNTNFAYMYIDLDKNVVYTNKKAYSNFADYAENLKALKTSGKYMIIRPQLSGYESNIKKINKEDSQAQEWKSSMPYYVDAKNYIYAAAVDTSYPVKDNFYEQSHIFAKYGTKTKMIGILGVGALAAYFAVLIMLTIGAGKVPENEEIHMNGFDRMKTELAALLVIMIWAVLAVLGTRFDFLTETDTDRLRFMVPAVNNSTQYLPELLTGCLLAAFTCAMFLWGYLSLVRRIKAKTVWKNSILRWGLVFLRDIYRNIRSLWKTIIGFAVFFILHWSCYLFIYWAVNDTLLPANPMTVLLFGLDVAVFIYLVERAKGIGQIKTGIDRIAGGEVDYQIPIQGLKEEQLEMAEQINSIGEGLDTALAKNMKSERLKTDLITNVSHDIKTPLTSIINYVDLLKQENFEDPKIQRYIEVLEQKSQRLKTLTEDVVEASKVSSGNITLEFMNINLVEMIQQTSGEFAEKFMARELKEVLNLPKEEVIIQADGRRLWRVLSNIYNNAAKYAMKGTRVYADLWKENGKAYFSLKNISEQPLNIPADELTERFIRGDVSRSTEGSGLGLSIAQSLTEMQGGKFELYLDGDLFKVTITFPSEV